MSCQSANNLNEAIKEAQGFKDVEIKQFLGDLIGFPKSEVLDYKGKDKAAFQHQRIFNLLYNRISEMSGLGASSNFNADEYSQFIQMIMMKQFDTIYYKMHEQNTGTLQKVYNHFNQLFKQQDNWYNKGKGGNMLGDPLMIAAKGDKSGKVFDIIKDTQELQDAVSNSSRQITDQIYTIKNYKRCYK